MHLMQKKNDIVGLASNHLCLNAVRKMLFFFSLNTLLNKSRSYCRAVNFEGFVIPKNAHVIPLLHAVHMNPDYWEEPEAFRPERFLSADGKTVQKPEHFMPFGVGQRMCLGDHLAEKEFFLFFSSLLHVFDLENPEGASLPGLRGVAGVTVTPTDFEVVCTPRHSHARTSG